MIKDFATKTTLVTFILLVSVFTSFASTPKRNSIIFFEIDDRAEVYVDGKKVYSKATSYGKLGEEVEFDLNPFLVEGKDQIVAVKLINYKCSWCKENDWKIGFEIYQNDESVDYIYEEGMDKGETKEILSFTYYWGYI